MAWIAATGWGPVFRPNEARTSADLANLGYVLNVIEDPQERARALADAWALVTQMLVVAARVNVDGRGYGKLAFGDGIVTGIGTFKKCHTQTELKQYLESRLGVEAIPATLGVYKDEACGRSRVSKILPDDLSTCIAPRWRPLSRSC